MNRLTDTIKRALAPYYPVSEETCQALTFATSIKDLAVNEIMEREKNPVHSEYIILNGIIRAYIINSQGDDITINFYTRGKAVTPSLMRSLHRSAFYNLEVLSKTASLVVFDINAMEEGMQNYPDLQQFAFRVMMQDAMQRVEREAILLKASGKDKLIWFRQQFPNLENEIQHFHIASYLGLTPTSFSRIRAGFAG